VLADSEPAGFVLVRAIPGGWTIAEFSIRPDLRRKGVGRAAVAALADLARQSESDYLTAEVQSWNSGAALFWSACGFERIGGEADVIELVCQLRPVSLIAERHPKPNVPW
jgi:ribosomal-protein-alanine N-acetyltransferase